MLEQNESIVTWVAPRGSKNMADQFPVIRIHRDYYSISLRMMKAIWRHVRLAKDFVNVDVSKDGGNRLRIPVKLFGEKKRTQNRFNVSVQYRRDFRIRHGEATLSKHINTLFAPFQTMRNRPSTPSSSSASSTIECSSSSGGDLSPLPTTSTIPKPTQPNQTSTTTKYHSTSRAHRLFCDLILPLSDDDVLPHLPDKTIFIFTEEDILSSTLLRIDKKCPQLFKDRDKFMKTVEMIVFGSVMVCLSGK